MTQPRRLANVANVDRRTFLKLAGLGAIAAVVPALWSLPKHRRIVIAAADASPAGKLAADVVCSGYNDDQVIQQIIDSGRSVEMTGGTFYFNHGIDLTNARHSLIVGNVFTGPMRGGITLGDTQKRYA